ncbi:lytic transglycosylase domain-containing protein [Pseudomonas corrugata]|uniref:lytic transglycosylase domain-containing protein n=1 Tax=Pseudomonas corrugata TaxID=47879 RepID=UPI0018E614CC|nr:lytic transglycosylase domain-containing protein [Pseudomonas corrugata]MBI6621562.1 lytic transglycosylase domain-containing protein [Pseudomonas corrugata]MBI6694203.1 lytic transglycosylase domain-containing protein [Pseudomonas corrugata]
MFFDPAIIALAQQCAPSVNEQSMAVLVKTESSYNPFAIGIVGTALAVQPTSKAAALETASALIRDGANISVGLAQINMNNFKGLGLTLDTAFDSCANLKAASQILSSCYTRAVAASGEGQVALQQAFSCYYSNNFKKGFEKEGDKKNSYVGQIALNNQKLLNVPRIEFTPEDVQQTAGTTAAPDKPVMPKPSVRASALEDLSIPKEKQAESWDVMNEFTTQP